MSIRIDIDIEITIRYSIVYCITNSISIIDCNNNYYNQNIRSNNRYCLIVSRREQIEK